LKKSEEKKPEGKKRLVLLIIAVIAFFMWIYSASAGYPYWIVVLSAVVCLASLIACVFVDALTRMGDAVFGDVHFP
jgi:hypothetical protein